MSREILFLAHRIPFPPNRGDKIRSHHILKRLTRMAPVHVACFADDDADLTEEVELTGLAHSYRLVRRSKPLIAAGLQALANGLPISLTAFHDPAISEYVEQVLATGRVGTIYVFSGQMGQYVPADFAGRVIMDFVDVDSAKFDAYAKAQKWPMNWVHAREARLLRAEEGRLAARADISLLISFREAELFTSRLVRGVRAQADVQVLGNGIDSDLYDPGIVAPEEQLEKLPAPRLIFTGQMDYPPNEAAVERVASRIMPRLRESLPEASFHIVGRNPTVQVAALASIPGVHVWGRVEDIRPWLKAADIAIVPLEIARGIQNKVLEAMAMSKPVVLTGAAAVGINAIAGLHYEIADSDEEMIAAILRLVENERRTSIMGLGARRFVVERLSWQSALAPLAQFIANGPLQGGHAE